MTVCERIALCFLVPCDILCRFSDFLVKIHLNPHAMRIAGAVFTGLKDHEILCIPLDLDAVTVLVADSRHLASAFRADNILLVFEDEQEIVIVVIGERLAAGSAPCG